MLDTGVGFIVFFAHPEHQDEREGNGERETTPRFSFLGYNGAMKYSDAFSRAIQTDDIGHIRSYYRFFRQPTETEFLMAIVHNAHQCIEFLTPKFFRAHPSLSFDLLQTASQSNRVDVLRFATKLKEWHIYMSAWGLENPHCGREAAHFLLDQWQGSTHPLVRNWKPNTAPIEQPILPQREDGPFTMARLSENDELFERLLTICEHRMDVLRLLQEQLLDTTRTHYSHCNFDAIFARVNTHVFFANEHFCLGILKKSAGLTFPSTISSVIQQPQLKTVATQHIHDLCETFFSNVHMWRNEDFVWGNAKALFDLAPQVFLQKWIPFYFEGANTSLTIKTFNDTLVEYTAEAVEALIEHAPADFVWDSHSLVGSHVIQHKLNKSLDSSSRGNTPRKM